MNNKSVPPKMEYYMKSVSDITTTTRASIPEDHSLPKKRKMSLPVLIIPGFMSSGLEVKKSSIKKSWEGGRIWLNLKELGYQSLTTDRTVNYNLNESYIRHVHYSNKSVLHNSKLSKSDKFKSEEQMKKQLEVEEKKKQLEIMNLWLKHMCLGPDMCSEVNGVEVRAIEGLEGVDYLTPGALTNAVSYVFGPVINALMQQGGYIPDKNLDAAPYDWRIPPSCVQERDNYMIRTASKIERLYRNSNETKVVLLCHSMGCKMGHYFMNWINANENYGPQWLEKYIHTYMPVGAPHIGAPKSIRATIDGDKMGLDTFLQDEEGLVMGRSLGSGPWLMPTTLPKHSAPPNAYIKKNDLIKVTLMPIDFSPFFMERRETKLSLGISICGGSWLKTDFKEPYTPNVRHYASTSLMYDFSDEFIFAIPDSSSSHFRKLRLPTIEVRLYDPGLGVKRRKSKNGLYYSWWCCPFRFCTNFFCVPFFIILFPLRLVWEMLTVSVNTAARMGGSRSILASSNKYKIPDLFTEENKNHYITVTLSHVYNKKDNCCGQFFRRNTYINVSLRVRWLKCPFTDTSDWSPIAVPSAIPSSSSIVSDSLSVQTEYHTIAKDLLPHNKNKHEKYECVPAQILFQEEGLARCKNLIKERYDNDPLGPRDILSSYDPPPVIKNVYAIYGINLPTEVGAVYKRYDLVKVHSKVQKVHVLDKDARLKSNKYYDIQNGVIMESSKTPQVILKSKNDDSINYQVDFKSGDGTVPYWSLQHCRTWHSPSCNVTINEIEGAEHRAILANSIFHDILINFLTNLQQDIPMDANASFRSSTIVHDVPVVAVANAVANSNQNQLYDEQYNAERYVNDKDESKGFIALHVDDVQDDSSYDSYDDYISDASTTSTSYNDADVYQNIDQHDISIFNSDNEDNDTDIERSNIKSEAAYYLRSIAIQNERLQNRDIMLSNEERKTMEECEDKLNDIVKQCDDNTNTTNFLSRYNNTVNFMACKKYMKDIRNNLNKFGLKTQESIDN